MPNTHGGARPGAGRPCEPITPDEDPRTPLTWLWQEMARRFGRETAEDIRAAFNKENQRYYQARQKNAERRH